ncbi:hypothetical protein NCC78_26040, partial [Micromonospora phytophila]|uniref:hypothetical protein n=1 Tax=Micromonospora phytophila TaxID=709888 RepID=UPI00202E4A11
LEGADRQPAAEERQRELEGADRQPAAEERQRELGGADRQPAPEERQPGGVDRAARSGQRDVGA